MNFINNEKYKNIVIIITAILFLGGTFGVLFKFSTSYIGGIHDTYTVCQLNEKLNSMNNISYQKEINSKDDVKIEIKEEKSPKNSKYYNLDKKGKNTKLNIYSMIKPEEQNEKESHSTPKIDFPKITVTFCSVSNYHTPEYYEGHKIDCPVGNVLKIDDVYFGRRAGDKEQCLKDQDGNKYEEKFITVTSEEKCELHPVNKIKELCENKRHCYIKPTSGLYGEPCRERSYYMDVTYHCVEHEKEDPKFAVVMFADNVKEDSIYEHAISQFAQYSDIHNYQFFLDTKVIDPERQIFYMKLYSIMKHLMEGLETKAYDWIFWVDGDVTLVNPNIKLDAFIPPEDQDDIHLVISDDYIGLNAGIFLIRVHPWSLNFLMKACSYTYYNKEKNLPYADQSAMLHVLLDFKEEGHYIAVPQNWFNSYCCSSDTYEGHVEKGDFLQHFAGQVNKENDVENFRKLVSQDDSWYSRTNSEMRKTVLKYYSLPKEKQHKFEFNSYNYK